MLIKFIYFETLDTGPPPHQTYLTVAYNLHHVQYYGRRIQTNNVAKESPSFDLLLDHLLFTTRLAYLEASLSAGLVAALWRILQEARPAAAAHFQGGGDWFSLLLG